MNEIFKYLILIFIFLQVQAMLKSCADTTIIHLHTGIFNDQYSEKVKQRVPLDANMGNHDCAAVDRMKQVAVASSNQALQDSSKVGIQSSTVVATVHMFGERKGLLK